MSDQAQLALKEKNYELAVQIFTKVLEKNPSDLDAIEGIAWAYRKLNRLEEAKQYAERTLALDPNRPLPYVTLSSIYSLQGADPSTVYELAETAYRLDPDSAVVLTSYGSASMLVKKYSQGVDVLEKAAQVEPDNALVHKNLMLGYVQLNKPEKVFREAKQVMRIKPTIEAWHWMVVSFLNRKGLRELCLGLFFGGFIMGIVLRSPGFLMIPASFGVLFLLNSIYWFVSGRRRAVFYIILDLLLFLVLLSLSRILR